jgi:hypothetical protein
MPQIIITTDGPGASEVHRERVSSIDVRSESASRRLAERIGWAVRDADEVGRDVEARYGAQGERDFVRSAGTIDDPALL